MRLTVLVIALLAVAGCAQSPAAPSRPVRYAGTSIIVHEETPEPCVSDTLPQALRDYTQLTATADGDTLAVRDQWGVAVTFRGGWYGGAWELATADVPDTTMPRTEGPCLLIEHPLSVTLRLTRTATGLEGLKSILWELRDARTHQPVGETVLDQSAVVLVAQ